MTTFDEREDAFERRFAHDEALAFRARARRTRQLGLWAAAALGRSEGEAVAYADALVSLDVGSGSDAVLARVCDDLKAAGVGPGEDEVRRHADALLAQARLEVRAG